VLLAAEAKAEAVFQINHCMHKRNVIILNLKNTVMKFDWEKRE